MYKYQISTIIPVYNVENFLDETIQSIVNQTIGFNNIRLILVNDGSTDNSEQICLKYKNEYPDNVVYINQKNQGVSVARNNGLEHAEGKYINFFDSDDLWERNAYEEAIKMFEKNQQISSVWFPMKFFDSKTSEHPLSYMYDKNRVINILKDYQYIKLSSASIILKNEIIKGRKYDKRIKISEDAKLMTEILMDNPYAGLVSNAYYLYRKRRDESSTINNSTKKKTWYIDTPKLVYKYLIDLSKKKFKKVIPYIQWAILYDFQWRIFNKIPINILTKEEKEDYIKDLHEIFQNIDYKLIEEAPYYNPLKKFHLISFINYGKINVECKNNQIIVNKVKINIEDYKLVINNINIHDDEITMYCKAPNIKEIIDNIYVYNEKNKKYKFEKYELDTKNKIINMPDEGQYAIENIGLKISLNLNEFKKIFIYCNINNKKEKIGIGLGSSTYFNKAFASIYRTTNNYYIKYNKDNNCFITYQKNIKNKLSLSLKLYFNLLKKKKFKNIIYRITANIYSLFNHKQIWLISDRIQYANDNGEAFFEYVMNNKKDNNYKYYFTIKKGCKDYKRLKEKYPKNVIAYNSFKYKVLFLKANKIVSAHADEYVINAFGKSKKYMTDMYNFKYVLLQHGIIKDDLSPWLNINSKQIDLFICSAKEEYKSLTDNKYKYNFPKKNIGLTGLARFDKLLKNDTEQTNTIILAPTWRAYIAGDIDPKTGKRSIDDNFVKIEYYKFYNELINNKKLINYLNEKNYKIRFIPHQNMHQYIKFFDKNDTVEIVTKSITYSKEFKQSKLLITDFSSTFFDFGYLHKPVIYTQFDTEKFFEGQIYDKGYFDYEKDGFGPITKTIEETVDTIIKAIDNNCVIDKKYEQRINKFYKYTDDKNSERIYNKIIELDEKK